MLEELTATIPLKQLLQLASDLHKQCVKILGLEVKSKYRGSMSLQKSKWNPENMDLDQIHLLKIDTFATEAVAIAQQTVHASVGDEILEFLIDGGAMISLVSYYIVEKLNLTSQPKPSERVVKFGDGALELTMGSVKLYYLPR